MSFEKHISNLIEQQFPDHFNEYGPVLVAFVKHYYEWLESKTPARLDWINPKRAFISIQSSSANVVGTETYFTENFSNGDSIAIAVKYKNCPVTRTIDFTDSDFEIFTIKSIANNTFLTLTEDHLPKVSLSNTYHAKVESKGNSLYLNRHFSEIKDIDATFEEYLVYFKEKYLKNIQFDTLTNTRELVKHSLDLYRSKGTERSIDLLYKIVFGKPAKLYYPGQDIFRLSSGDWYIPTYLELSNSPLLPQFKNKQVVGVTSGATCFVEEIVKMLINGKIVNVGFFSSVSGTFQTGEKIKLAAGSVDMKLAPVIVGSLNEVEVSTSGTGNSFTNNEIVNITSTYGTNALGKVVSTANSVGTLSYVIADGGYGYTNTEQTIPIGARVRVEDGNTTVLGFFANLTGTVAVSNGSSNIEGTSTDFEVDFDVGDYIVVWANSSYKDVLQINSITNSTFLDTTNTSTFTDSGANYAFGEGFANSFSANDYISVYSNSSTYETQLVITVVSPVELTTNVAFSFTNANAAVSYTRYTAQTFISEKILTLSDVTVNSLYNDDEFFGFQQLIIQPFADINYEGANNDFANNDLLYTYHANGDVKGTGRILSVAKTTSNSGLITAAVLSGNLNSNEIFTESNVVSAVLSVANGYVDRTCNAYVIGHYSNALLNFSNGSGTFSNNELVTQAVTGAQGYVIDKFGNTVTVGNTYGIFKNGFVITGANSGANGYVDTLTIDVGVIDITNTFTTIGNNYIHSSNSHLTGRVESVSLGSGASVTVGNTLLYTESINVGIDYISSFLSYKLAEGISVTVDTDVNATTLFILSTGTTTNLESGWAIANSSNLDVVNTDIAITIDTIINSTAFSVDTDAIVANGSADLIVRVQWPFVANLDTDLESVIGDSLTYSNLTIGKIDSIVASSPGVDYNKSPIIRFYEPNIYPLNRKYKWELEISSLTSNFAEGELITQEATNARGLVVSANDTFMLIQNLRLSEDDEFITTSNSTTVIVGSSSGTTANVDTVTERTYSSVFGLNNEVDISLASFTGAITSVKVIDSGYGFTNGEVVSITANNKTANGFAVLTTHGTGSGWYKTNDGFLSSEKKLSDGEYYQEYSYVVRSSIINEFKDSLKNVVHVAGTKYFSELFYDTVNQTNSTSNNVLTEYTAAEIYNGNFPIGDYNPMRYYYIFEENENVFPVGDFMMLPFSGFDMNGTPSSYINTSIDLQANTDSIINVLYDCNSESETIDLEDTLRRVS